MAMTPSARLDMDSQSDDDAPDIDDIDANQNPTATP
jgi:hypothetical protein